jgi:hypothetical protein
MLEASLVRAVEQFVNITWNTADSDLDRDWAWGAYDTEGVRFAFFRTYEELRELAIKTAGERSARGLIPSAAQRILAQYHAAYRDLQAALLGIGPDEENLVPTKDEWPVRQTVAHIVLADMGFFGVVKYALDRHRTGDGRPAEIHEEAWDAMLEMDEDAIKALLDSPLAELQAYYQMLHERVLNEFADISDEELAVPSLYWEGCELSLQFRLHRFDSHVRQHTIQIEKALPAIGCPPTEARRLSRLLLGALADAEGAAIGAWELSKELWSETVAIIQARTDQIANILAQ